MGHIESQPEAVQPRDASPELLKDLLEGFVKKGLYKLDGMDQDHLGFRERAQEKLDSVETDLKQLEKAYPKDPDVHVLREMYEDLKSDFERGFHMDFDSSFKSIVKEMEQELKASGVKVETPENTILTKTVKQLEAIGIHPSYVVTQGDPNAPTIVLYKMIHPNPGMDQKLRDDAGITQSQHDVFNGITAANKAGLTDLVYAEGWEYGEEMDLGEGSKLRGMITGDENSMAIGALRAETELGNKLQLIGADERPLLRNLIHGIGIEYRATSHNILIAENVANDLIIRGESLAFLPFGALHESFDVDPALEGHEQPVPLSHLLAYNGINVIVVDAATPYANFSPEVMAELSQLEISKSMRGTKEKTEKHSGFTSMGYKEPQSKRKDNVDNVSLDDINKSIAKLKTDIGDKK